MSGSKASRLKVFQAQFGFYDSVVAAPSQVAALRAWGTHQNLFADGRATVATDQAAVAAALVHPNIPLRRAVGSNAAFEVEPTSLPVVPDEPRLRSAKRGTDGPSPKTPPKPRPDRSILDAAERAVADVDARRKQEEQEFERRQRRLDEEKAEAASASSNGRRAATAAVVTARKAYRQAGGVD